MKIAQMKRIPIEALFDHFYCYRGRVFIKRHWRGCTKKIRSYAAILHNGYRIIHTFGTVIPESHAVFAFYNKRWPKENMELDHIDGNPLNNKIWNLREVTHQENLLNQKVHRLGRLPYTLYLKKKNVWAAIIPVKLAKKHGVKAYYGRYNTNHEANQVSMRVIAELIGTCK